MACLPFDSFSYRALRMVARGEIGAADDTGMLRHRTDDLSAQILGAWMRELPTADLESPAGAAALAGRRREGS